MLLELVDGAALHLKNRTIDTAQASPYSFPEAAANVAASYAALHLLVQLDHPPNDADFREFADRGAIVTAYVPDNGLVVWAPGPESIRLPGTLWIGKIEPADKISSLLTPELAWPRDILIEFHSDVALEDARAILADMNIAVSALFDAGPHRLLITADFDQLAELAAHDETAYLFPAVSNELTDTGARPCLSALTTKGSIGQYIAAVGDGWGGPEHRAVTLGYYFSNAPATLSTAVVQSEMLRAFGAWSQAVQVSFAPADAALAERTVNVLFAAADHGDGFNFDGRGSVLAHTFYPAPPNAEPLAGDMHFDSAENWQSGANTDLFSVALHEAGHALGLGHSDSPSDVMYPYYRRVSALAAGDINAARKLYPANDGSAATPAQPPEPVPLTLTVLQAPASTSADSVTLQGTASGGSGTLAVAWSTDHGFAGAATGGATWSATVPLASGANTITVTASDASRQTATRQVSVTRQAAMPTPASLTVLSPLPAPLVRTTQPSIAVSGTASHTSGIKAVSWSSSRGSSGVARGTSNWDTGPIALDTGVNQLTLTAQPVEGIPATYSLLVNYAPAPANDTLPPTITIVAPSSATSATSATTVTVRGTAADSGGIALVTWSTLAGDHGTATGTANWNTGPIPLLTGYNTIQITAADASGNSSTRTISVTRR